MKYIGMPLGMWALFAGSFRRQLTVVFGYDAAAAKEIMKRAKPQYRKLIAKLPAFEKADRFQMNIVNCAMLGAFICSMPERPDVERLTVYYADAKMTKPMKWFCRKSGKKKFTEKGHRGDAGHSRAEGGGPQPVFLEHGILCLPRRQRL